MSTVGYSGKPLGDKLGIKSGEVVYAINAPDHYADLLGQLPEGATIVYSMPAEEARFIHIFVRSKEELAEQGSACARKLAAGGSLWISWPKKSSRIATDVTEDTLREVLLPLGIVDVKVCAVDADWSGLKFLWRRAG